MRSARACMILVVLLILLGCDRGAAESRPEQKAGKQMLQIERMDSAPAPGIPPGLRYRYTDDAGEHILVLAEETSVPEQTDDAPLDRHAFDISLYSRGHGTAAHRRTWHHRRHFDCPGLDFEAGYLEDAIRVDDLDMDGVAEVLVGYRSFCGGGIEPQLITLVLHAADGDYLMEGESLVEPPGGPAFGGSHAMTPHESVVPEAIRTALLAAWERVKRVGAGPSAAG